MNDQSRRIGLLAGLGEVPVYFADRAMHNGIRIVSVAFTDEIHSQLMPFVERGYFIGLGKMGKIFQTFRDEGITDLVMLGKVDKSVIFRPDAPKSIPGKSLPQFRIPELKGLQTTLCSPAFAATVLAK